MIDAHDVETLADRLGGGELDRLEVAALLRLSPGGIWTLVRRGKLPRPARRVPDPGRCRHGGGPLVAHWTARQVAGAMLERGLA